MLKSCKYCGRIHDSKYNCGRKPVFKKRGTKVDKFHSSYKWTQKSIDIRRRDKELCQACRYNLDGTGVRYNYKNISVHHIVPLEEDFDLRLEDENLVSLCDRHHEMAEQNIIERNILTKIAKNNTKKHESGL